MDGRTEFSSLDRVCIACRAVKIGKHGVRTDPGKVWKVLEFDVEIFKALESLENDHRYGKVEKSLKTV